MLLGAMGRVDRGSRTACLGENLSRFATLGHMNRIPAHRRRRAALAVRHILGWSALTVFVALVAVWTVLGFAPHRAEALPGALADLGKPDAWWPIAALFAAAAVGILCLGRHDGLRIPTSTIVLGVFGVSAVILGIAGYWPCSGEESPGWTPLRRTFDLFGGTLDLPFGKVHGCPAELPLGLQVARLLALATIVILAGGVIAVIFRSTVSRVRARLAREIVVVTGLSPETVGMVRHIRDSATDRRRVVVIETGDDVAALARSLGVLVVPVDTSDPTAVRRFLSGRSARAVAGLHFLSDDSAANLRTMSLFLATLPESPRPSEVPARIVVRIDNPWIAENWRRTHLAAHPGWLVEATSTYEVAARHVVARLRATATTTIVVTGSSPFELAVLQELSFDRRVATALGVEIAPLTVVLGGTRSDEVALHLRRQLQRLEIDEITVDLSAPGRSLTELMDSGDQRALLLSPDAGADATFLATVHPEWAIFAWDPSVRGITTTPLIGELTLVGPTLEPVSGQGTDIWEWFGRIAHAQYLDTWNGGGPTPGDPNRGSWDGDLSAFARESNIRSFAALLRNASLVRARWANQWDVDRSTIAELTNADLDILARAEHLSWVRHHEENGWKFGAVRDDRRLRHPDLVEWNALTDDARAKDVDSVRATLALLDILGFRLVRE